MKNEKIVLIRDLFMWTFMGLVIPMLWICNDKTLRETSNIYVEYYKKKLGIS